MVLLIVGVATALVSVEIGRSYDKQALRSESARLRAALRQAREMALFKRASATISFDLAGYKLTPPGGAVESVPLDHRLPDGMTIETRYPDITFSSKGSSSGGKVLIRSREGRALELRVDTVTGSVVIHGAP